MAASNVLTSSSPRSPDWSWSIMSRALSSMGGEGVVGGGLTTYLKHIVHVYVYIYMCVFIYSYLFYLESHEIISYHLTIISPKDQV